MLFTDSAPEYHGELIDFDPVWFEPKPLQAGGPPILFGAMGPLGVKHAARWADGWFPVDIALPDVRRGIEDFRQLVRDEGRDPDEIEITLGIMSPEITADLLKSYRDMGIHRCNIGVGEQNWDKPEVVMPMIERFAKIIPEL